jgi:gliding motility-associated-like protein
MKKIISITLLSIILSNFLFAQKPDSIKKDFGENYIDISALPKYENNRLFVKVKNDNNYNIIYNNNKFADRKSGQLLKDAVKDNKINKIEKTFKISKNKSLSKVYTISFNDLESNIDKIISDFNLLGIFDYVEKVPLYYSFYSPNDYNIVSQTYLSKINAQGGWDITQGSSAIKIAIIDDAVKITHNDLKNKIWTNTNENPNNNIDDDNNGYVDDFHGFDVANNDGDVNPPITASNTYFTHGTHVAGIAGAETNNGTGVASVGYKCSIIPIKCKVDSTYGSSLQFPYLGLEYAITQMPDVINMSWGGFAFSNTYELLFKAAHDTGIVLVAAAGNTGTDIALFPASYNFVISVGSTNLSDCISMFSSYGNNLDVMAPGVNILSTLAGSNTSYGTMSGTSMAAPIVSAICALIKSNNTAMTPDEIELCLKGGCNNINWQNQSYIGKIGAGRVNVLGAVTCSEAPPGPIICNGSYGVFICQGSSYQFSASSLGLNATSWYWQFPGGTPSTSTDQNPTITYNIPGSYNVILSGCNQYGCDTISFANFVTVGFPSAQMSADNIGTVCKGSAAYLDVNFTGRPPFTIIYTDGTTLDTINDITTSHFEIMVVPQTPTTYSLVWMQDAVCIGGVSGSVTFNPIECGECSNTDFEFGNFVTWRGMLGKCCGDSNFIYGMIPERQKIVSIPGFDSYSNNTVTQLAPNSGHFTARLGNYFVGGESEKLVKSFLITPDNANFTYQYAVFLEDPPGHSHIKKPKFQVDIFDENHQLLPDQCAHYEVTAGPETDSWVHNGLVRYKDWSTVSVDLTTYLGQTITVEFKTEDCGLLGHFGYAYIDAYCGPMTIAVNDFCENADSISISAPVGYDSYLWHPGGDTSRTITIVTPIDGDSISVTMQNEMGCNSSLTHIFHSLPKPIPIISNDTTICLQDTAYLTCSGAGQGGTYIWTSNPPGFQSNNQSIVVIPEVSTTYIVNIINSNGCAADSLAKVMVTVNDSLHFDLGPDKEFCTGDSVILIADSISGNYSWTSYPPGYSSDSNYVVLHPQYQSTDYILTIDNGHCNYTDKINLHLYDYMYLHPITKVYYCTGNNSITLSAPSNVNNILWIETMETTNDITINNPVEYSIYSVSFVSAVGCLDTLRYMLQKIPDPIANAGPDTFLCKGFVVPLTASGANTSNGTYEWTSIPVGFTSTDNTIYPSPEDTTLYIVKVTNGPDCTSPPSYDTVKVNVIASPVFELGDDIVLCYGDSITLTVSVKDGFDFWTSDPPGFLSNDTTVVLKPLEPTIYYLTVNTSVCTYSDYLKIDLNYGSMLPDTFLVNYCKYDSVITISAPEGFMEYFWQSTGDTTRTITISDNEPGNIFVVFGRNNLTGCNDTIIIKLNSGLALAPPQIEISDTVICKGEIVSLSIDNQSSAFVSWYSSIDTTCQHGADISVSPDSSLTYVCLINKNGCIGSDTVKIEVKNKPNFNLGNDTTLCFGDSVILQPLINFEYYAWWDNTADSVKVIKTSGTYFFEAKNGDCSFKDEVNIIVLPEVIPFIVPNVITPNNDGKNDYLEIADLKTEFYSITIFNRWGEMVYTSTTVDEKWYGEKDGVKLADGTYFYIAKYKSICSQKETDSKGVITILR